MLSMTGFLKANQIGFQCRLWEVKRLNLLSTKLVMYESQMQNKKGQTFRFVIKLDVLCIPLFTQCFFFLMFYLLITIIIK